MTLRDYEVCADRCPPNRPCPHRARQLANWYAAARGERPTLIRKARNLLRDAAGHLIQGHHRSTEQEAAHLAICRACPSGLYGEDAFGFPRCNHLTCGCQLAIKIKWAEFRCPMGHWQDES